MSGVPDIPSAGASSSADVARSAESRTTWRKHVLEVQTRRNPEAIKEAMARADSARQQQLMYKRCNAVKQHVVRSRALAAAGMERMSKSAPTSQMEVHERWRNAQDASNARQAKQLQKYNSARVEERGSAAPDSAEEECEEQQGLVEAAFFMGATDVDTFAELGSEGLEGSGPGANLEQGRIQKLLEQLRYEPADETEAAAKFMLYDGYSEEVRQMRDTLFQFFTESQSTMPVAVQTELKKNLDKIDNQEAMGIPDDFKDWIVFHMMRKAERNNAGMANILDAFEKKMAFLAERTQTECPVCMEPFAAEGPQAALILGCCHKVCCECWGQWTSTTHGTPFCPVCRHEEFLSHITTDD